MKDKDIDFLKTLIIKLDISIEAERNNVNADGLMLILDFSEKNRKESIIKGLDILNKTQKKWQKLKKWLIKTFPKKNIKNNYIAGVRDAYEQIINKMQELEAEDIEN